MDQLLISGLHTQASCSNLLLKNLYNIAGYPFSVCNPIQRQALSTQGFNNLWAHSTVLDQYRDKCTQTLQVLIDDLRPLLCLSRLNYRSWSKSKLNYLYIDRNLLSVSNSNFPHGVPDWFRSLHRFVWEDGHLCLEPTLHLEGTKASGQ